MGHQNKTKQKIHPPNLFDEMIRLMSHKLAVPFACVILLTALAPLLLHFFANELFDNEIQDSILGSSFILPVIQFMSCSMAPLVLGYLLEMLEGSTDRNLFRAERFAIFTNAFLVIFVLFLDLTRQQTVVWIVSFTSVLGICVVALLGRALTVIFPIVFSSNLVNLSISFYSISVFLLPHCLIPSDSGHSIAAIGLLFALLFALSGLVFLARCCLLLQQRDRKEFCLSTEMQLIALSSLLFLSRIITLPLMYIGRLVGTSDENALMLLENGVVCVCIHAVVTTVLLSRLSQLSNHQIARSDLQKEAMQGIIRHVAHELNTPMNCITIALNLMRDLFVGGSGGCSPCGDSLKSESRVEITECLSQGLQSAALSELVLNNLVTCADLASGQFSLKKTATLASKFTHNCFDSLRRPFNRCGVNTVHAWDGVSDATFLNLSQDNSRKILIDIERINQLCHNMLHYSINNSESGGTVTISTEILSNNHSFHNMSSSVSFPTFMGSVGRLSSQLIGGNAKIFCDSGSGMNDDSNHSNQLQPDSFFRITLKYSDRELSLDEESKRSFSHRLDDQLTQELWLGTSRGIAAAHGAVLTISTTPIEPAAISAKLIPYGMVKSYTVINIDFPLLADEGISLYTDRHTERQSCTVKFSSNNSNSRRSLNPQTSPSAARAKMNPYETYNIESHSSSTVTQQDILSGRIAIPETREREIGFDEPDELRNLSCLNTVANTEVRQVQNGFIGTPMLTDNSSPSSVLPTSPTMHSDFLRGLRVLVVDDSPICLQIIVRYLTRLGALCVPVKDGTEAVNLIKISFRNESWEADDDGGGRTSMNSTGTNLPTLALRSNSNHMQCDNLISNSHSIDVNDDNATECHDYQQQQQQHPMAPKCTTSSIDFVVMDNHMPKMCGPAACAKMRELGYLGPIFGLTGNIMQADLLDYKNHGATHVFSKPLHHQLFQDTVVPYLSSCYENHHQHHQHQTHHIQIHQQKI